MSGLFGHRGLLLGASAGSGVPLPASPSLLCHFDGSDGSTTMADSSPANRTITAFGDAQIDTAQSVFGGSSLLLDGTGDYLTVPSSSDFLFGSGDFTVRCRLRRQTQSGDRVIAAVWAGTSSQLSWLFGVSGSTDRLVFYYSTNGSSGNFSAVTGTNVPVGSWTDLEVSRVSGTLTLYIDGVFGYTATHSGSFFASSAPLSIGASESGGSYGNLLSAHADELVVMKGTALHSANFTPATAPYQYP